MTQAYAQAPYAAPAMGWGASLVPPPAPPPVAARPVNDWAAHTAADGRTYYYCSITKQTTWEVRARGRVVPRAALTQLLSAEAGGVDDSG